MRLLTGFEGMPYSGADLRREFARTHDIRPVDDPVRGRQWSGNRIGFPAICAAVADTPLELAVRLRAEREDIDRILNRHSPG